MRSSGDFSMRLDKYLADAGIGTRQTAKKIIKSGAVSVNGTPVTDAGAHIQASDTVTVDGAPVTYQRHRYYMLNKPAGYVTTMSDDGGRKTVADLIRDVGHRVYPVGRLDYNTTGLLLMTNDGDLAYRLTHPKHEIGKTYVALVSGVISDVRLNRLRRGVDIGGFVTSPAKVRVLKQNPHSTVVEITIHEGKNRQVRKMFNAVGNKVMKLERTAIGDIRLGHQLPGHWRKLTRQEIDYLKSL